MRWRFVSSSDFLRELRAQLTAGVGFSLNSTIEDAGGAASCAYGFVLPRPSLGSLRDSTLAIPS